MTESKTRFWLRQIIAGGSLQVPPADLDPGALAAEARRQGVTSLVLAGVADDRSPWVASAQPLLRADRRVALARTLSQLVHAGRIATLLAARGVRILPLKGAAIAESVCEADLDRPMSDVDLLALDGWSEAKAALLAEGQVEIARADHAWAFRDRASGVVLELHRALTSAPGLFPLDGEGLWARRRAGRGQQAFVPSAEDLLLHAALHAGFQHGLVLSLVQWLDFRRILERERLDLARLQEIATAARARPLVGAALLVAEAVVAAPVPTSLRPLVDAVPRGMRRWLDRRLAEPLRFVTPAEPGLARVRWRLLAGRRAELVFRTLVRPETDSGDARLAPRLLDGARRAVRLARVSSRVSSR